MLAKVKDWWLFMWIKNINYERKRRADLRKVAKREKMWDMKLRGLR